MKATAKLQDVVRTAGITLLIALIASRVMFSSGATHTDQREFGRGAGNAACCLYIVWALVAIITAVLRWRAVRKGFWVVFTVNMCIVAMLVADFLTNR